MPHSDKPSPAANPVRTRFAPSPPGSLSVRGARAALYNWLYARSGGGSFVLRLYDSGGARRGEKGEAALLDDLAWLGLEWDEGPDVGGGRGPYRTSERLGAYRRAAMRLLEGGRAYRCFCAREELEEAGRRARAAGLPPVYDGRCSSIPADEARRRAESGEPFTVRFKVPKSGEIVIDDLVRGRVSLGALMVGDFVLLDASSVPTYDFAAVHDDDSMGITHVLRGEDRLPNTLRQVLLYNAMGLDQPAFGHLPLIVRSDGDKLTSRGDMASIKWFRDRGYLSEAMFNYLATLGWSPGGGREVMDKTALSRSFNLKGISSDAATFDPVKLSWMNAHYIRSLHADEFWRLASRFVPGEWIEKLGERAARDVAMLARKRVKTLRELSEEMDPFVEHKIGDEAAAVIKEKWARDILRGLAGALEGRSQMSGRSFLELLAEVGKNAETKGKSVFLPVRAAITGRIEGPEMGAVADLLGVREMRRRLTRALDIR